MLAGGEGEPEPPGVVAELLLVDQLERVLGVGVEEGALLAAPVEIDFGQERGHHHGAQANGDREVLEIQSKMSYADIGNLTGPHRIKKGLQLTSSMYGTTILTLRYLMTHRQSRIERVCFNNQSICLQQQQQQLQGGSGVCSSDRASGMSRWTFGLE